MTNQRQGVVEEKQLRSKIADLRNARKILTQNRKELDKRYKSVSAFIKDQDKKLELALVTAEALLENMRRLRSNDIDQSQAVDEVENGVLEFHAFSTKLGELCGDFSHLLLDNSSASKE